MLARLRTLARNLAIYGLGDVATNIVSFLLLPLYVHFLTPDDYGAIALLYSVEIVGKILFRWGVDASFMRLWYDCRNEAEQRRLASTIFWFLFAANGVVLAACLAAIPIISARVFGFAGYELPLALVLVNTFVIGFYFLPFHILRMGERSTSFAILTTSRTAATLVARFALIVGLQFGLLGFVLADVIVTAVFTIVLARWFAPYLRLAFSWSVLGQCLRFGLPRVPHGMAQQVTSVSDRYFVSHFSGLSAVGLYSVGASFAQAMKLFLSAFEFAWAPFYYATMKESDAKATFRTVTTYGIAVLVLLEAGLAAVATDAVRLMTTPEFDGAARVVPWIGLGIVFHGVYLLTSIGLNITKQTRFYPVATGIAACASLVGNVALVPRFGAIGAAWTNAIAYAVLALTALILSQRVYPIPLEWGRLLRLALAGVAAWLVSTLVPSSWSAAGGLLARGAVVCATYPALLFLLGFYDRREMRAVARLVAGLRARRANVPDAPAALDGPVEAGGAIMEVPLVQDDLRDDEIVIDRRPVATVQSPGESTGRVRRSSSGALAGIALVAILALAAWLRVRGLGFGLPAVYNPDEIAIMSRALAFAKGDLNPHNFLYPTFYFYVLFAWIGAYFAGAWTLGAVPSLFAFQTQFFVDPSGIYLAGRTLGVVCGVATAWLVYELGKRLFGVRAGLVAALLMAVAPTAVRDAHYVKHDVPVTLAIVVAYLAIVRLGLGSRLTALGSRTVLSGSGLRAPGSGVGATGYGLRATGSRNAAIAGALCGVAFSTHYYSIFLVFPLLLAVYFSRRSLAQSYPEPEAWSPEPEALSYPEPGARSPEPPNRGVWPGVLRDGLIALVAAALVFFALSPFLLIEPRTAWQDIVANRQIVMDRAVGRGGLFASGGTYLHLLWTEAVGWPVVVAALTGLVLAGRQRPREALLLLAFPLPLFTLISNTVAASRYLNPILPFVALFAGYAVSQAASAVQAVAPAGGRSRESRGRTTGALLTAALSLALAVPGLDLSIGLGRFFRQTDTRTLAQRYIESRIPAGSTVLVQPYSVQLVQSRESLTEALAARLGDPERASTKFALRLALDPYPAPAYRTIYLGDGGLDADKIYVSLREVDGSAGLTPLERLGVEYVVLKRYNVEDSAVLRLRAMLLARGRLVARFSPYRSNLDARTQALVAPFLHNTDTAYDPALDRPGPGLEIWALAREAGAASNGSGSGSRGISSGM